jgi:hypothetical protein
MKCHKARELFPDELAGTLAEAERVALAAHLASCAACRDEQGSLRDMWQKLSLLPELEPSAEADSHFQVMLRGFRAGADQVKREAAPRLALPDWLRNWWTLKPAWQFAALLVLFIGGVFAGWALWHGSGRLERQRQRELADLRVEISSLREQMALSLLERQSAGERLLGIEWSSRLEQPDHQILRALLHALDSDPNVNVRLAAVDALKPFAIQAAVKKALLEALPQQESPLVQIELIHLMVEKEQQESAPVLKSLTENRTLDESVRERARWGLSQLGV